MSINLISMIILLGIVQGFFLAFILFHNKKGNYIANRFLGLLLCAISASILNIFLIGTGFFRIFPYTLKLSPSFLLLFGPLFFFYVRTLLSGEIPLQRNDYLHFIPSLLAFVRFIPFYLADNTTKCTLVLPTNNLHDLHHFQFVHYEFMAIIISSQLHLWTYLFSISKILKEYQQKIKDYYSTIEQHNLDWIRFFINSFSVVYVIFFLLSIFVIKMNYPILFNIMGLVVSFSIFVLGYRGLIQTEIFSLMEPSKNSKNESNVITTDKAQSLIIQLDKLMNEEKLFTNSELTLDDLAKKLAVSRNILSQFFNDNLKTNFYDYINRLRVDEMKRLLLDAEKEFMTIIALSVEAGFKSKATLNRIFKQYTKVTPTQFKHHNRPQPNQGVLPSKP